MQTVGECAALSALSEPRTAEAPCLTEASERLQAALAELQTEAPPIKWRLFCGRFLDHRGFEELAEESNLTPGAVRACCYRMRKRLCELLERSGQCEGLAAIRPEKKKTK